MRRSWGKSSSRQWIISSRACTARATGERAVATREEEQEQEEGEGLSTGTVEDGTANTADTASLSSSRGTRPDRALHRRPTPTRLTELVLPSQTTQTRTMRPPRAYSAIRRRSLPVAQVDRTLPCRPSHRERWPAPRRSLPASTEQPHQRRAPHPYLGEPRSPGQAPTLVRVTPAVKARPRRSTPASRHTQRRLSTSTARA